MKSTIIDTHLHVWDFTKAEYKWLEGDTSILNRSYLLEEVFPEAAPAGIEGAVLVQAANNQEDTALMLAYAQANQWIKGVVGWLPLLDPDGVQDLLQEWKKQPVLKGMRHLIHNEKDPAWLLQPPVMESLRQIADAGLSFDLVGVQPQHMETAIAVVEQIPHLRMVLDHLNQPPLMQGWERQDWEALIKEIATHASVYAKISGMGTMAGSLEKNWLGKISPAVQYCLTCFGPERCMLGSDWPVALLAGSYQQHWQAYRQLVQYCVPVDQQHYLWRTSAQQFYQLN